MKLVIDIDDKVYRMFKKNNFLNMDEDEIRDMIRNGLPYKSFTCKDCILGDEKGCVLEYYPCIYEAIEYVYRRKERT